MTRAVGPSPAKQGTGGLGAEDWGMARAGHGGEGRERRRGFRPRSTTSTSPHQCGSPSPTAPGCLGGDLYLQEEVQQAITRQEKRHPEVAVLREVAQGGARAALLAAAHDAQLLVVGSRGQGGIKGMLLGSVSQAVLHHAPCPVAVVRPH
jgi:nucleotide-binding universal stress UspA family protein